MSLIGIDHVQLAMPPGGEARARAFYAGILGFDEIAKPLSLAHRGGVWLRQGNVRIHLGVEANFKSARKAHPAFLVDDLASMIGALSDARCHPAADSDHLGRKRCYLDEPFGNRLEFIQVASTS